MNDDAPSLHYVPRPRFHVEAAKLDPGCDLLVYNHPDVFRMILEQEAPAWAIAEALNAYGQQALDEGIWQRVPVPRRTHTTTHARTTR